jgi:hypothetical protein
MYRAGVSQDCAVAARAAPERDLPSGATGSPAITTIFSADRRFLLAMAIGDVAGKGMRPPVDGDDPIRDALSPGARGPESPAQIVSAAQPSDLLPARAPEKYATFFFGIYDGATGLLTYTNAATATDPGAGRNHQKSWKSPGRWWALFHPRTMKEPDRAQGGGHAGGLHRRNHRAGGRLGRCFGEARMLDALMKHQGAESARSWRGDGGGARMDGIAGITG